jgi:hypothetical protein
MIQQDIINYIRLHVKQLLIVSDFNNQAVAYAQTDIQTDGRTDGQTDRHT